MPPFHFPFFYNSNHYNRYNRQNLYTNDVNQNTPETKASNNSNNSRNSNNSCNSINFNNSNDSKNTSNEEFFIELFGLRLYFDDILLICLLFFLYNEGVQDDELFISLILLLLS